MLSQAKLPVSVIIATKNEEKNLPKCLESVAFADQVVIIDSQSTDQTCELATRAGAETYQFHYDGGWPKKRNWALENVDLRNDWILILDADERVSPALQSEMARAMTSNDCDAYYVKWRFVFLGKWMKHSWSHGWMLRFFRKGKAAYEDLGMRTEGGWDAEVHENITSTGSCRRLKNVLDHESNEDLAFWIRKQNQFSDWNAERRIQQMAEASISIRDLLARDPLKRRKALKAIFIRLPGKPILMFTYLYLFKLGFLDGKAGYYFCVLRAIHEFNIQAKIFERSISAPRETSQLSSSKPSAGGRS